MATLNKIIKLTQEQYDTLASGGTVGEYTGINESYLYLVQSEDNYVDLTSDQEIQGIKTFKDGIKLEMTPGAVVGGDQFGHEIICVSQNGNILTSENNVFIYAENEQLAIHCLVDPQYDDDAATKQYVDLINLESQTKVKRFI